MTSRPNSRHVTVGWDLCTVIVEEHDAIFLVIHKLSVIWGQKYRILRTPRGRVIHIMGIPWGWMWQVGQMVRRWDLILLVRSVT